MKKLLLTLALVVCAFIYVDAQPRAIGANVGYGASVSYQHSLGEANFLDIAVEFPGFSGVGASCTYDWVNPFNTAIPWNEKGSWNWSLGVGAGGGVIFVPGGVGGYVGAVGHCGVAYDFWFPLQLSVDYRPNLGVVLASAYEGGTAAAFYGSGLFTGISIGVRYRF